MVEHRQRLAGFHKARVILLLFFFFSSSVFLFFFSGFVLLAFKHIINKFNQTPPSEDKNWDLPPQVLS